MRGTTNRSLRLSVALLGGAVWTAVLCGPALGQSSQTQELINRIQRLQQELTTLQSYVYRGSTPPAGRAVQAPAPVTPGGEAGGPVVAQLSVRMTQLENEIRRLTGQNEEFGHTIRQLQARLDKLVTDVDTRLSALERRAGAPGAADAAAAEPPGNAALPPAPPTGAAPGPQVIGQLRVDPATGKPLPAPPGAAPVLTPPQQAAVPRETPEQMYERAQTLLLKEQNVAEAEKVLRTFLDAHPKHTLAANAHYWLGRTYFVRKDYKQAAITFAEGFQKYPKSDKAPANLLNLGMSLARLDRAREACTAFQRLTQNFPDADAAIKRRVAGERQRAKCR